MLPKPDSAESARAELVLVDTSVWIRFFRHPNSAEAMALDELLSVAAVATCAPIRAEVISGAPTLRAFRQLQDRFGALVDLELPHDVWQRLEEQRFTLARRGYQASLVDLMIALTAHAHHAALWTLDEDFQRIAAVVPVHSYRLQELPQNA